MKLKFVAAAATAIALAAPTVHAREFADIYTDCGLGAMIAPTNGAVAAVTNVTWDLGTTAILSNASSPETCQGGKKKSAAYIFQSYAQLEKDLAQGHGEHLAALVAIANCPAGAQSAVVAGLRQSLAVAAAQPGYASSGRVAQASVMHGAFTRQAEAAACNLG